MGLRPIPKTLSRRLLERNLERAIVSLELGSSDDNGVVSVDLGGVGRYRHWMPHGPFISVDLKPDHRPAIVARGESLPLTNASVDLVLSTEVLEHCPEPERLAAEAHRILRPGGVLVLSTPFVYVVHGWPDDYFRYTASGLRYLFRQFQSVEIVSFGNRFVVIYDLIVGFTPLLSSWVNPVVSRLVGDATSELCPAGHVLVARK